jgi:hypothetical protein
VIGGTVALQLMSMLATGRFDLPATFETIGTGAATLALVWLTMRRVGNLIDRELRQTAEARRLLTEEDDVSGHERAP